MGGVEVRTADEDGSSNSNIMSILMKIDNKSDEQVDIGDYTIYYTFDDSYDGDYGIQRYYYGVDYARQDINNVSVEILNDDDNITGNELVKISFPSKTVNANGIAELKFGVHRNNWSNFDESSDYSYGGTSNQYILNDKIVVVKDGVVVFGIPKPDVDYGVSNILDSSIAIYSTVQENSDVMVQGLVSEYGNGINTSSPPLAIFANEGIDFHFKDDESGNKKLQYYSDLGYEYIFHPWGNELWRVRDENGIYKFIYENGDFIGIEGTILDKINENIDRVSKLSEKYGINYSPSYFNWGWGSSEFEIINNLNLFDKTEPETYGGKDHYKDHVTDEGTTAGKVTVNPFHPQMIELFEIMTNFIADFYVRNNKTPEFYFINTDEAYCFLESKYTPDVAKTSKGTFFTAVINDRINRVLRIFTEKGLDISKLRFPFWADMVLPFGDVDDWEHYIGETDANNALSHINQLAFPIIWMYSNYGGEDENSVNSFNGYLHGSIDAAQEYLNFGTCYATDNMAPYNLRDAKAKILSTVTSYESQYYSSKSLINIVAGWSSDWTITEESDNADNYNTNGSLKKQAKWDGLAFMSNYGKHDDYFNLTDYPDDRIANFENNRMNNFENDIFVDLRQKYYKYYRRIQLGNVVILGHYHVRGNTNFKMENYALYARSDVNVNDRAVIGKSYSNTGLLGSSDVSNYIYNIRVGSDAVVNDIHSVGGVYLRSNSSSGKLLFPNTLDLDMLQLQAQDGATYSSIEYDNTLLENRLLFTLKPLIPQTEWFGDVSLEPKNNMTVSDKNSLGFTLRDDGIYELNKDLILKRNNKLKLSSGRYYLNSLILDTDAEIELNFIDDKPIELYLYGKFELGNRCKITSINSDYTNEDIAEKFIISSSTHDKITIFDASWRGTIIAPRSYIEIYTSENTQYGAFFGKSVTLHQGSYLEHVPYAFYGYDFTATDATEAMSEIEIEEYFYITPPMNPMIDSYDFKYSALESCVLNISVKTNQNNIIYNDEINYITPLVEQNYSITNFSNLLQENEQYTITITDGNSNSTTCQFYYIN